MSDQELLTEYVQRTRPTSATVLVTLCGQEPRHYMTELETETALRAICGLPLDAKVDPNSTVPGERIRAFGKVIGKHPGPLGQKDRRWQDVLRWAQKESYDPEIRAACLRLGEAIARDLTSPYRRVYCETLEHPSLIFLDVEKRKERAAAAAVRAFLAALYYALPAR